MTIRADLRKNGAEPADRAVHRTGYRDVLRVPYAQRLLVGTLIGRLPNGMAPLAILLASAHRHGAALAALYLLASAAGGPLIGRLVDRTGQTAAFSASAIVSGAALAVVAAGPRQPWCAVAAVMIAGGAKAPLEGGLRSLIGTGPESVMPTRAHQRTALALDAASQELIYVLGPVMVAGIVMTASASGALLATAALGIAGTTLVVTTPPSRCWTAAAGRRADWLGPFRSQRLRALYLGMVGVGIPIGALTPLALDAADRFGQPGLSGVLPAALSVGAVMGGLVYGAHTWPGTPVQHLLVLTSAFAVGWLPMVVAASSTTAVVAAAVPGLVMAPLLGVAFVVTGSLAPRGTVTEAHALLVAALDVGCAAGAACAGLFPAMALLPGGAAVAALLLVAARHRLTAPEHCSLLPAS
ncbi:MFS transporter [Streptomyces sp. NPDC097610]|uniref:MFS transporter n=1 Tax=Streptomyces sp. NPDC097610 TaxID=3157227 RepID=UPI00331EBB1E